MNFNRWQASHEIAKLAEVDPGVENPDFWQGGQVHCSQVLGSPDGSPNGLQDLISDMAISISSCCRPLLQGMLRQAS